MKISIPLSVILLLLVAPLTAFACGEERGVADGQGEGSCTIEVAGCGVEGENSDADSTVAQPGAKRATLQYTDPVGKNNDGPCTACTQPVFQEAHDPPQNLLQTQSQRRIPWVVGYFR